MWPSTRQTGTRSRRRARSVPCHDYVKVGRHTKANFTQVMGETSFGTTYFFVIAGGSGQTPTELTTADVPSGGTVHIWVYGHYEV